MNKILQLKYFLSFLVLLSISLTQLTAQTPVNDLCSGATEITNLDGNVFAGTTVGSTNIGAPLSCADSGNLSESGGVWYSIQSTISTEFDINIFLCNSETDTRLGVFSGSCNGLVPVNGGDDSDKCGDDPSLLVTIVPNTSYYLYVTTAGFGTEGNFTVNINSANPPVAVCRDYSAGVNASGNATVTAENINNQSQADFGIQSLEITAGTTTFDCTDVGNTFPLTLTVTDNNGDTNDCSSTVTVTDAVPPSAVTINPTVTIPASGTVTVTSTDIVASTSDNCPSGTPTITVEPNTFTINEFGPNPVTVTVTDPGGASSSYPVTVTVDGDTNPVAVCQDHVVELDASGVGTCSLENIDGGSYAPLGQMFLGISSGQTDFTCADVGSAFAVELMITDDNGTSDQCTATVTVEDNIAPTITGGSYYLSVAEGQTLTIDGTQAAYATDNCETPTVTVSPNEFTTANNGLNTVTVTATDPSGNPATTVSNVYINETNPNGPTPYCQPQADVYLSTDGQEVPSYTIDAGSSAPTGIASYATSPTIGCADVGNVVPVTLTVTDNNGTTATCVSNVTVYAGSSTFDFSGYDLNSTSVFVPAGQTVACSSLFSGSVSSLCGGSVSFEYSPETISWEDAGNDFYSIGVTATDSDGSTSSNYYSYDLDTDGPIARCASPNAEVPTFISATSINNGSSATNGIASIVLQDGDFSLSCADANTSTSVTLVVTDNSGFSSTCSTSVYANDPSPNIVANNITISVAAGETRTITGADVGYFASDNCESVTGPEISPNELTSNNAGQNFVSVCAETASGQVGCEYIIVTVETNAPAAYCTSPYITLDEFGGASISAADVDAGSFSNAGIASLSLSGQTFYGCADVGNSYPLTLTVTDNNGASASCETSVYVNAGSPPVATIQDISIGIAPGASYTVQPTELYSNASNACGIGTPDVTPNVFTTEDNPGDNYVTLNIPTSNGSPYYYYPNVYVNMPPNGGCASTTAVPVETPVLTSHIDGNATADNGIASTSISPTGIMFACEDIEAGASEEVTLTVTDNLGHVSTCMTTVVPADITPPVIVANDITIVVNQGDSHTITLEDLGATFTDECSGMNTNPSYAPTFYSDTYYDYNAGQNTVYINAYDEAFNYGQTTAIVTVEVNNLPAAVCQDYTVSLDGSGNGTVSELNIDGGSIAPAGLAATAITIDQSTFTCDNHGATFPATLTVTDVNGATDDCTATVTVADNLPPVVVTQDITIAVAAGQTTFVTPNQVHVSSSDNCGVASMTLSPNAYTFDNAGSTYPAILDVVDINGNHSNTPVNITVADAPQNVACGSAIPLPEGEFTGSTINVTNSDPAPTSCEDSGDLTVAPGVWYYYVGDGNTCSLDFCGSSGNTRVGVYTGTCGAYSCITGGDSNNSGDCPSTDDPLIVFPTVSGTTYYIYVTHGTPGEEDNFSVNATTVGAPTASCFPNYPVYLDDAGNGSISAAQINCASNVPAGLASPDGLAITDGPTTFDCSNAGETPTVTLTVTDDLGQTSTCTSTVSVIDNTEPVVVLVENPTVIAEDGETITLNPEDYIVSASDNCDGDIVYSINPPTLTPPNEGEYPVIITITPPTGDPIEIPVTVTVTNQPDLCGQAASISCGQTLTGSTAGATTIDAPEFCQTNVNTAPGVWYTFAGTGDYITFTTCGATSNYDTKLAIYSGSCGDLACVGGDDDDPSCTVGNQSTVSFESELNVTYYIYVSGFSSNTGDYGLSCTCTPPPVANCNSHTVEIGANGTGSLTIADIDNGSSAAAGIASLAITAGATDYTCADVTPNALPDDYVAPTVTLTVTDNNGLTATCNGSITVVDNIAPVVTVENITIIVTTGQIVTVEPSEVITSVVDNCESEITYELTPSTFVPEDEGDNPVTLTVYPLGGQPINIPVTITVINIPVNNECTGAESIACGQSITGTTEGATTIGAPAACFNSGDMSGTPGVWYTFTGTGENVELSLAGSALDTKMAVYTGGCDNGLTCVTGDDDTVGDDAVVYFGTETGVTYYIYVTGSGGNVGSYTLSCGCFPALPNDACANAELMSAEGLYNGTNVGGNATNPPAACGLSGNLSTSPGVWYTYEGDNTMVTLALCGSEGDTKMAIYEGDCGNLTCMDGEDDDFSECSGNDPSITWNAEIGKTYYIYVTNFGTNNSDPFVIDLVSITPPDAACVPYICNLDASGNGSVTVANVDGGSTAEAGIQSIAITSGALSYDCSDVGTPASVTLTVTDNNGTTGTCNSTITVVDAIAPVVVPQDITINVLPDEPVEVAPSQCIFSMSDNCEIATSELSMTEFTQDNEGNNPVMITVTDVNGNPTMVPANVFVINRYPLDVICRQPISTCNAPGECGRGNITILPPHIPLGMELESLVNDAPDYFPVGTTDVIWTVTSTFGLVSECVSQVIISDEEAPLIDCPANIVRYTEPDQCTASVFLDMDMTDNCGIASIAGNGLITVPIGLHVQEFVATDMAGNTTTCTTTIAVHDVIAPVVVSVPEDFMVTAPAGVSEIQVSLPAPVITDACGIHIILLSSDILPVGETTEISWRGLDDYCNSVTVSYNVTVTANQAIVTGNSNESTTIALASTGAFDSSDTFTSSEDFDFTKTFDSSKVASAEIEKLFKLETSVYPNPARERATLDIGELPKGYLTITLMDNMGRTLEERFYQGSGNERLEFDLSLYPKGMLMFRLTQDDELIDIQRLVKQ